MWFYVYRPSLPFQTTEIVLHNLPSPFPSIHEAQQRYSTWPNVNPYRVAITQYIPPLHQPNVILLLTIREMIAAG